MEMLNNTEAELKKSAAYNKKSCIGWMTYRRYELRVA